MSPTQPTLTADEFVDRWRSSGQGERQGSQSHFNDLCALLGVLTPTEADPSGEEYCFEKRVARMTGGDGFADVWRRGYFGWEYKGPGRDLDRAYWQLSDYRDALENPRLLIVSDMDRIVIRTNFTGTKPQQYAVTLDDLADPERRPEALRILRAVMTDPDALRPDQSPDQVTEAAAQQFASIARSLQERGFDTEVVAHFLNRILFCLFAEDVGLLPRRLLTEMIESRANRPEEFRDALSELFGHMSSREATRYFGNARIEWFNGGLFDGAPVIEFTREELAQVRDASRLDWSQVEPSILGTLFERGLDPDKRGQLGAHYTDATKIEMVVEPVVMVPLRREFAAMQARVDELMAGRSPSPVTREGRRRANLPTWERQAEAAWRTFLDRLRAVRVLDPACGSGNFLYLTLRKLKDLEQQTLRWGGERLNVMGEFPEVGPHNVLGIELNPYARELAGVSIWVGHIQWMIDNGYGFPRDPVLEPLSNIELRDAILAYDAEGKPVPAEWPEAEFVVGNPPFLGDRMMRGGLGHEYVEALRATYKGRLPGGVDLVCYWHELARAAIEQGRTRRAGLLATNSIRGGLNRRVLERIKSTGDVFMAWADEPWVVDGAAVRVSIVAQDDGSETEKSLDGAGVALIRPDLSGGTTTAPDLSQAIRLVQNSGASFVGVQKSGPFDLTRDEARDLMLAGPNPNGRPTSDVVRPWMNGVDIVDRPGDRFIVDFGTSSTEVQAAMYEAAFEYVRTHVLPIREEVRRKAHRERWWIHGDARPGMRDRLSGLKRYLATPHVSKHRIFAWIATSVLPSNIVIVIARDDDYAFGVLHSRAHELWSLRMGTSLEDRPRYTPTSTFETFPFPWPLNTPDADLTPEQQAHRDAIGAAAKALDDDRRAWLNPPEWVREEPDVVPSLPPRLVPVDEEAERQLKQRTLTNLYNARPAWLEHRHADLDRAVFAAYGWAEDPADLEEETILARLLALNLERAGAQ